MYLDDGVPVDHAHAVKDAIAQDAGVVDHAIDAPECLHGGLDDALGRRRVGNAVAVCDRLPSGLLDFVDHLVGDRFVAAIAFRRAAEIIDHDLGPARGCHQRDFPADTAARARHDDDFSIQALCHVGLSLELRPAHQHIAGPRPRVPPRPSAASSATLT